MTASFLLYSSSLCQNLIIFNVIQSRPMKALLNEAWINRDIYFKWYNSNILPSQAHFIMQLAVEQWDIFIPHLYEYISLTQQLHTYNNTIQQLSWYPVVLYDDCCNYYVCINVGNVPWCSYALKLQVMVSFVNCYCDFEV